MKIQILQENLEKSVNITTRFASTKAQLPILSNILISAKNNKLFLSSTNLEISSSVECGAKVEKEGEISVPAKVMSDLVANLPNETVNMESEKEQLKISTSGYSSTILGINPADFPKVPNYINKKKAIFITKKEIVNSLNKVIFAVSIDETRPILTGVLFILKKNSLSLIATDGFRLSRKTINAKDIGKENKSVVIPKGVLGEIGRGIFESDEVYFSLDEKDNQAIFGLDDTVFTSRLLEGDYPDFEKIIPKEASIKIILDKEELLRAVKLASIFARESANIVKIKVLIDSVKILAESGTSGSQDMKVDAKVEREEKGDFEIAFNYRYLEDFIHSVTGSEVQMEFNNSASAGVFRDTSDPDYLHLIMPVKI